MTITGWAMFLPTMRSLGDRTEMLESYKMGWAPMWCTFNRLGF